MSEIAVAGGDEFLLGFRLAGVRYIYDVEENSMKQIENIMSDDKIGILVVDGKITSLLPDYFQNKLNNSVKPVVVIISTDSGDAEIRKKIIRAIGVDLWEGD